LYGFAKQSGIREKIDIKEVGLGLELDFHRTTKDRVRP
jgi:hypothetical protein